VSALHSSPCPISATALNVDLLLLEEIEALSEEEVEDLGVGVS